MADMRDRLIELLAKYFTIGDSYSYNLTRVKTAFDIGTMTMDDFEEFDDDTIADIADYLLANGVILPPCKVGDDIYSVEWSYRLANYILVKYTVKELLYATKRGIRPWIVVCLGETRFNNQDFGKTVFLTLEEAQEAHKERNNNEKR